MEHEKQKEEFQISDEEREEIDQTISYLSENRELELIKDGLHDFAQGLKKACLGLWKMKLVFVCISLFLMSTLMCVSIYKVSALIEQMIKQEPVIVEVPVRVLEVKYKNTNEENNQLYDQPELSI